jgi:hypothetical protein
MNARLTAAALVAALAPWAATANEPVYRWVDRDGVIHYSEKAPDKDAKPASLPSLQTYTPRSGARPAASAPISTAKPAPGGVSDVRILSPVAEEIFRDPTQPIQITAASQPGLPEGAGYIFYLDGIAKNAKPVQSPSLLLNSVDRGAHTIAVAVVDGTGRELKRSAPVTFHRLPPVAR